MTKSKVYLLDSNVLIALATPEHSLNSRAAAWFLRGTGLQHALSRKARFSVSTCAPVWRRRRNLQSSCSNRFPPSRGTNSGRTMFLILTCQPQESSGIGRSLTLTLCCWRGNTAVQWPLWTRRWLLFTQAPHSSRSSCGSANRHGGRGNPHCLNLLEGRVDRWRRANGKGSKRVHDGIRLFIFDFGPAQWMRREYYATTMG